MADQPPPPPPNEKEFAAEIRKKLMSMPDGMIPDELREQIAAMRDAIDSEKQQAIYSSLIFLGCVLVVVLIFRKYGAMIQFSSPLVSTTAYVNWFECAEWINSYLQ